jgi:hypothetical protein
MNNLKIAYLVLHCIFQMFLLYIAVWGPSVEWTVFAIAVFILGSMGLTDRINSWGDLGQI